jgi:hypothetical protein
MSVKSKVLASGAAVAMVAGGLGVTALTAHAATPSCGSSCVDLYTYGWGSGSVTDVYKASATVNQKVILWTAVNYDRAEDWTISDQGTVHQFYKAGLASAALNLHYRNDEAFELEYTPDGVETGLCMAAEAKAGNGTQVVLKECGVSAKTLWVEDSGNEQTADSVTYTDLINGSDTNFSDPYVLSNDAGTLKTHQLEKFSDGSIYDSQLWAQESGVL